MKPGSYMSWRTFCWENSKGFRSCLTPCPRLCMSGGRGLTAVWQYAVTCRRYTTTPMQTIVSPRGYLPTSNNSVAQQEKERHKQQIPGFGYDPFAASSAAVSGCCCQISPHVLKKRPDTVAQPPSEF